VPSSSSIESEQSTINHTPQIPDQSHSIAPSPSVNNSIDCNPTSSPPPDPYNTPDCDHDSRPRRMQRLPLRYRDELPEAPLPVAQDQPTSRPTRVILHVFDSICTCFNKFGIARQYRHRPSYDPDAIVSADELSNICPTESHISDHRIQDGEVPSGDSSRPPPWPWQNMSVWRLMSWMVTGLSILTALTSAWFLKSVRRLDVPQYYISNNCNTERILSGRE
jgi:hypothetical protein